MSDAQSLEPFLRNALLSSLPIEVLGLVLSKLDRVTLKQGDVIYCADQQMEWVYFVERGMISLVLEFGGGLRGEVGIVGLNGVLGATFTAGIETAFTDAIVQLPGIAYRMDAAVFHTVLQQQPVLRSLVQRYACMLLVQMSQTAACNARHGLKERLARWLLMAHDCVEGDVLPVTQEFLAMMLGVHRPSVTVTASMLQRAGLLRYGGGVVKVIDRSGLEEASCECYTTVKKRVARMMDQELGQKFQRS